MQDDSGGIVPVLHLEHRCTWSDMKNMDPKAPKPHGSRVLIFCGLGMHLLDADTKLQELYLSL